MPKVHLVIPVYNHYELTDQLLLSLYQQEKANIDSVLVVDDDSLDEEVSSGLFWWEKQKLLPLTNLMSNTNQGFLKNSNTGLRLKSVQNQPEDILILISNDVKVQGKFIEQVKEIIGGNPKSLVGGIVYLHDTGWNKFGDKVFPYVEGWLLAMTIQGWQELGYFDEQYSVCDFEDVDLSTKAIAKGYELVSLNNPALVHTGGGTLGYTEKRLAQTKINQIKFGEKWTR